MIKEINAFIACDNYGEYSLFFNAETGELITGFDGNDLHWTGYIQDLIEMLGIEVNRVEWNDIFDDEEDCRLFLRDYHGYDAYEGETYE